MGGTPILRGCGDVAPVVGEEPIQGSMFTVGDTMARRRIPAALAARLNAHRYPTLNPEEKLRRCEERAKVSSSFVFVKEREIVTKGKYSSISKIESSIFSLYFCISVSLERCRSNCSQVLFYRTRLLRVFFHVLAAVF